MNNDGYDDTLIEAFYDENSPRMDRLYVYLGGTEMDTIPDIVMNGHSPNFG